MLDPRKMGHDGLCHSRDSVPECHAFRQCCHVVIDTLQRWVGAFWVIEYAFVYSSCNDITILSYALKISNDI